MTVPVVAIDGPSASGKGTVARQVAEALGFHYLESGALYRLVALASLAEAGGVPTERWPQLANKLDAQFRQGRVFLQKQDVTDALQSEACSRRASEVASVPEVRVALLGRQRAFRKAPGLVADGRDMGTVVFPDATLKVFLTATPEVRALRRHKQLIEKGIHATLAALSRDLQERDRRDATRTVAPLVPAPDARQIDSSTLTVEEVTGRILGWYREGTRRTSP
jgi:cytidylate kinase